MHVQTTLTHAAHLAEIAHRALCEMAYDQNAWTPIQSAGKVSELVDAGIQLKSAYTTLRAIAAAIAAQAAELAEIYSPAAPAEAAAAERNTPPLHRQPATLEEYARQQLNESQAGAFAEPPPDGAPFAARVARALRDPLAEPPRDAAGITTALADEVEQIIGIIARLQADPDYTRELGAHHMSRQSPSDQLPAMQAILANLRQVAATLAAPATPAPPAPPAPPIRSAAELKP